MKKIKYLLVLLLLLTSCSLNKKIEQQDKFNYYMSSVIDIDNNELPPLNTMINLTMYDEDILNEYYDEIDNLFSKYHQLVDNYYYYQDENNILINNIKVINDSYATNTAVVVDPLLIDLLIEAKEMMKLTQGYFNFTIGELIELYRLKLSPFPIENTDPDQELINQAIGCSATVDNIDEILVIDSINNTVMFNHIDSCTTKASLNLGAFSKGYITDVVYKKLLGSNSSFILDIGASNISTYSSINQPYTIGLKSPINKTQSLYALSIYNDSMLSTSGDDNNYYLKKNDDGTTTLRSHILNPFTGYSENYYRTVSVISNSSMICDTLSTALFNIDDQSTIDKIISDITKIYKSDISLSFISSNQEEGYVDIVADKEFIELIVENSTQPNVKNITER